MPLGDKSENNWLQRCKCKFLGFKTLWCFLSGFICQMAPQKDAIRAASSGIPYCYFHILIKDVWLNPTWDPWCRPSGRPVQYLFNLCVWILNTSLDYKLREANLFFLNARKKWAKTNFQSMKFPFFYLLCIYSILCFDPRNNPRNKWRAQVHRYTNSIERLQYHNVN